MFGFFVVSVIPTGRGWPRKLQTPLMTISDLATVVVNDANLMPRNRHATGNNFDSIAMVSGNRHGVRFLSQRRAINAIHNQPASWRRKRQADAIFSQPINRCESTRIESVFLKATAKRANRFGANGFSTARN